MKIIRRTYRLIRNFIFFVVVLLLGFVGLAVVLFSLAEISNPELALIWLPMMLLGSVLFSFPFVVARERIRDRRLLRWLAENQEQLAEGAQGPGGVVYRFDTVLVRYKANLSLLVLATGFDSGFYVHGERHRLPKFLYTLFSLLLGWWSYSWTDWLENLVDVLHNLSDSNVITVAELFELDGLT